MLRLAPRASIVLTIAALGLLIANSATATTWTMVQTGHALSYHKGYQTPDASWTSPSFVEDNSWTPSASGFGIGYGDGDDSTVLSDMSGNYATVYVRSHFTLGAEAASILHLELEAIFDDGFVAYLNGTEIARSHVPAGALQASTTASNHEASSGPETFTVDPALLVQGDNVLAVEVHNGSLGSSDLSFIPTLTGHDTPPPKASITHGPFQQQLSRNDVLIVWETDAPSASVVAWGPTEALGSKTEDATPKTHHVIKLDGLKPSSTYYYQVESAKGDVQGGRIRTEVYATEPYRFLAFGDTRSNHNDHAAVIKALMPHEPRLAFHSGDLVGTGSNASHWYTFFGIETPMMANTSLYPTIGNHEGNGALYLGFFELPDSSPGGERYYAVRYATTLVVVLDQYGSGGIGSGSTQVDWLDQTLASADQEQNIKLKLVFMHHGPYDSGSHKSNISARNVLVPIFEKHGVDIAFSGHDHDYERGTVNGVKYIVSGGGGAPLYSLAGDFWTEIAESVNHYCLLDIHGPKLELTAYRVDGSVLDSFVLGDDVNECSSATDCEPRPAGTCWAGETGEWACVQGACIYNCYEKSEPPDGGAGAQAGSPATGGAGTGGASAATSSGAGGSASPDGGCSCRLGSQPMTLAGWLWLATLLAGSFRSRRRSAQRPTR